MLEKMQHIWPYEGLHGGNTAPCYRGSYIFLESSRRADVNLCLICNVVTYRFRNIRDSMAKLGVSEAKMVHPSPFLDPTFGDP